MSLLQVATGRWHAGCHAGKFRPSNTRTTGYEDNVASWLSVQPADDHTANSTVAFALAAAAR